ncbi:hypothetical protein MHF_0159 [Mycoplasma haemofelis Ohio2]|uniref:Uncharacterized protein n=1 Tax=Mycoplasma haemofelis (strain Ohio2) TaxID=859194 RepID=F6FFZ4_MYCHI|nr:hypothetical protein MHF_0159 [Mycoplasma haemofelis Ohio2]
MISKAAAIGTVGVASAGGVGAWYALSKDKEVISISKKIEVQGERFILSTSENTHDTQWGSLITSYTQILSSNPDKKPLIKEFSKQAPTQDSLKGWCKNQAKEDHEQKERFDSFREWCTKDNISQHIRTSTRLKRSPLTLGDSEWENKKTTYISSATSDNQITDAKGQKIDKTALKEVKDLQEWCFKNAKELHTDENSHTFKAYKEWCTKDIAVTTSSET